MKFCYIYFDGYYYPKYRISEDSKWEYFIIKNNQCVVDNIKIDRNFLTGIIANFSREYLCFNNERNLHAFIGGINFDINISRKPIHIKIDHLDREDYITLDD